MTDNEEELVNALIAAKEALGMLIAEHMAQHDVEAMAEVLNRQFETGKKTNELVAERYTIIEQTLQKYKGVNGNG